MHNHIIGKAYIDDDEYKAQTFAMSLQNQFDRPILLPSAHVLTATDTVRHHLQKENELIQMCDELTLMKSDPDELWGFRLTGGRDFGIPLTVLRVVGGSIAEKCGVCVGDMIVSINGKPANQYTHTKAQREVHDCGNHVQFTVLRGSLVLPPPLTPIRGNMPPLLYTLSDGQIEFSQVHLSQQQVETTSTIPEGVLQNGLSGHDVATGEYATHNGGVCLEKKGDEDEHKPDMTDEEIAELLSGESELLDLPTKPNAAVLGINFQKFIPRVEFIKDSEVFKVSICPSVLHASLPFSSSTKRTRPCSSAMFFIPQPDKVLQKEQLHKELSEEEQLAKNQYQRFSAFLTPKSSPISRHSPNPWPVWKCPKPLRSSWCFPGSFKEKRTPVKKVEEQIVTAFFTQKLGRVYLSPVPFERAGTNVIEPSGEYLAVPNTKEIVAQTKPQEEVVADTYLSVISQSNMDAMKQYGGSKENNKKEAGQKEAVISDEILTIKKDAENSFIEATVESTEIKELVQCSNAATSRSDEKESKADEDWKREQILDTEISNRNVELSSRADGKWRESHTDWKKELIAQTEQCEEKAEVEECETFLGEKAYEICHATPKEKVKFTLTPQMRPVVLPGGRQWRQPKDAANEEMYNETLIAQAEVLVGSTIGVNFWKYMPPKFEMSHSEVYRLIHEIECHTKDVAEHPEKVSAEEDYYQQPISKRHFYAATLPITPHYTIGPIQPGE